MTETCSILSAGIVRLAPDVEEDGDPDPDDGEGGAKKK